MKRGGGGGGGLLLFYIYIYIYISLSLSLSLSLSVSRLSLSLKKKKKKWSLCSRRLCVSLGLLRPPLSLSLCALRLAQLRCPPSISPAHLDMPDLNLSLCSRRCMQSVVSFKKHKHYLACITAGHAQEGKGQQDLDCFEQMQSEGILRGLGVEQ